jgi:hypothetical protein
LNARHHRDHVHDHHEEAQMPKRRTPSTRARPKKPANKEKPRRTTRAATPPAERNADDRETTQKKAPFESG